MSKEQREVSGFDRVRLRDWGILRITQGEQESLTIEADEQVLDRVRTTVKDRELVLRVGGDWLDRLSTALSRELREAHLRYDLTVKELRALRIFGAGKVTVGNLKTDRIEVTLHGAGDVTLQSLTADQLRAELSGAGKLEIAGRVKRQGIKLSGAGSYAGGRLESRQARVNVSGAGSATVWVTDDLDVTLSGVGSVEYYGDPNLSQQTSGLGSVRQIKTH
jgi:hypothetical protein